MYVGLFICNIPATLPKLIRKNLPPIFKEITLCLEFESKALTSSETKNGVPLDKLDDFINSLKNYKKINLVGLMTMSDASQSDEEKQEVFRKLNELKNKYHLKELSMGMSNDYKLALLEGATYVRLGRIICE